jgi:hypothetical protein
VTKCCVCDLFANGDIHRSLGATPQDSGFVPLPFGQRP